MSLLIDTHAHINFRDYRKDGNEVVERALENNIWMINVGAEADTSKRAVEYAERFPEGVFASVGLHPIHLRAQKIKEKDMQFEVSAEEFNEQTYRRLAEHPRVVAIGEIGLDYYRRNKEEEIEDEDKNKQKEIFIKQLELAREVNKPIIIHCREAHKELLDILVSHSSPLASPAGVVHSFSGNHGQARQYRELGFKIAFNGIITFARDYDRVILDTPLEDILLETDCPYLAPVPYRGRRNEPLYITEVAKKLAKIKKASLEKVREQTTINAKEVFNLI